MAEYVKRSDALQAVGDVHPLDYNGQGIVERIKSIPAADVVERPRWIPVTELDAFAPGPGAAEGGNKMTYEELESRFTYHSPKEGQPERYEQIRYRAKMLAAYINESCPESREKSLALTKIDEAVMWANAAIARNE